MLSWEKIVQSLNFTMVANLVNFAILVGVLSWLLYDPAREFIQKRKQKIQDRIEDARQRQGEAEELREKRTEELQEARTRAQEIIDNAEQTAEQIKQESREEAQEEASRIIEQAQQEAEREKQRVREELRQQYLNAAILGAEKVLSREVDEEDHQEAIDSFLDQLEEDQVVTG